MRDFYPKYTLFSVLILISLVLLSGCTEKNGYDLSNPKNTTILFIEGIQEHDRSKIYDLFCSEIQSNTTEDELYNKNFEDLEKVFEITEYRGFVTLTQGENAKTSTKLIVKVNETYLHYPEEGSYLRGNLSVRLVLENEEWRIKSFKLFRKD